MWRKQFHTLDHPPLLVIVEPILTGSKLAMIGCPVVAACLDACWLGELSQQPMCHTSHTDGDEATSLSVTLGIRHTHRHSASKRG